MFQQSFFLNCALWSIIFGRIIRVVNSLNSVNIYRASAFLQVTRSTGYAFELIFPEKLFHDLTAWDDFRCKNFPTPSTQFKVEKQSSNVRSPFTTHHTPWKPSNLHAQIEFSNEKREIGRGPIPAKVHNVCNKTIFYSGNVVPFRMAHDHCCFGACKKAETTRTGEIWFNERK